LSMEFPEFAAVTGDLGLSGVLAFPLRHGGGSLGALDPYRKSPPALEEDVLTAYVVNAQARADLEASAERDRGAVRACVRSGASAATSWPSWSTSSATPWPPSPASPWIC
jgi:hypothetical protein